VFDLALLAAEVVSATIVAWLVAQYIYTVYFDTAPRRITPPAEPTAYRQVLTGAQGLGAGTSTPTRITQVTPPPQGGPDGGAVDREGGGDYGAGSTHRSTAAWPAWVSTITPTATPTIDPKLLLPSRLRIPVMFLDSPVHEVVVNMGVWEVSPMQIGHHEGTANPGETGNMVLAGHRDINSALFRELDRLKPGDDVFVSNSLREYRYVVKESIVVSPDHTEVMDPTDDKRVTLITCTPIGLATQRLVVRAILDEQAGTR
jgi:LPXTG-site transpeptidase (sortase) family protein